MTKTFKTTQALLASVKEAIRVLSGFKKGKVKIIIGYDTQNKEYYQYLSGW